MAFTNTPVVSTYSTHRIPCVYDLDIPPGWYSTLSSYGMRNIVPIKLGEDVIGEGRNALTAVSISGNTGVVRGMYVWEKTVGTLYYFVVVGNDAGASKVYTSTNGTTWAVVTTLTNNATTPVRFTEFIDATNVKKLVMVDGIEGYVFTSNAAGTKIVDVDFPTPHVPFPVFIDGYLCLAKAGTGDIYNSDLNDPAIWTAGSFISSELYPDDIQALLKIDNYVVAIGTQGTEYFYDAANPTASPLARVDGAALAFGTPFPNSIAYTKNSAIFLANNNDGSISLRHIQGTKVEELPLPLVTVLSSVITSTSAPKLRGWFYRQSGHLYYGLTVNGVDPISSDVGDSCYVYGLDTQIWTEFTYNHTTVSGEASFPVVFTAPTTSNSLVTYFAGQATGPPFFGTFTTAGADTIGGVATTTVQEIRTSIQDFGSLNLKTMSKLSVVMTTTTGTYPLLSDSISVICNDSGDYSTTSANSFSTTIGKNGSLYPYATQLGAFRQRNITLRYDDDLSVRWKAIEVEINKGMR